MLRAGQRERESRECPGPWCPVQAIAGPAQTGVTRTQEKTETLDTGQSEHGPHILTNAHRVNNTGSV